MKMKGGGYVSYKTHNYCPRCEIWLEGKPVKCPECFNTARRRERYAGRKEIEVGRY